MKRTWLGHVIEQIEKGCVRGKIITIPAIAEESTIRSGVSQANIFGTILMRIQLRGAICDSDKKKPPR
jgi:hypothetical protein